jgi:hypothetical protein
MIGNLKALIVVLGIALIVFSLAKPIYLRFSTEEIFNRRRNLWFVLTITAFLTPSFWLYALVAAPLLAWAGSKDPNPLAVYLLFLCVIPPWGFEIPTAGIGKLFDMTQPKILALVVLLPAVWRAMSNSRLTVLDYLILSFGLLQIILYTPYESTTNSVRRGLVFLLDIYLPFLAARITCTDRGRIIEAMAAFVLACALFAPLAAFETARTWVLYAQIGDHWGYEDLEPYLLRGRFLRAQASTGHALSLGYLMAMGFGFWLFLRSRFQSSSIPLLGALWMWLGLLAAYSRGPWLTAGVVYVLFLLLHPAGSGRFLKSMLLLSLIFGAILISPLGENIIDNLPFIGTVDQQNVVYREQLVETSMMLIKRNPFFGDPFVLLQMENLRQGQGIIDIMNAYASIALFYGLVGLSIFLIFNFIGISRATIALRHCRHADPALSLLGAALVACMLGTMFFMATAGFTALQYVLLGLLTSYAALATAIRLPSVQSSAQTA